MLTTYQYFLFPTLLLLHLVHFSQPNPLCTPSACGIIPNISFPFRLQTDPTNCGNRVLGCENNLTSIYLLSLQYCVQAINYENSTIRLVDASLYNDDICSFPSYSPYFPFFWGDSPYMYRYDTPTYSIPINFISCPLPLKNSSLYNEITTTHCGSGSVFNGRYAYVKVGHMNTSEVPYNCQDELIAMTSWEFGDLNNVSLSEIHHALLYGFELIFCSDCKPFSKSGMWLVLLIPLSILGLLCAAVSPPLFTIFGFAAVFVLLIHAAYHPLGIISKSFVNIEPKIEVFLILAPRFIIFPLAMWFLINKFRRRHLSVYNRIESFLQRDNKLAPIRYSFTEIKKMTKGFQDKLGEGGYGSVYKGKLQSGLHVAVKLLGKSGGNGQDFMSEIATIGRIHHVNVVKLVGYCAEGSKRALVYDFMPNGSLEKYLFNREKMSCLNWDTKFEIAVGVAHGIEYLHRGCDVQILHFDIKPHNILLDDNFIPKVSDFGLAKTFSTEKNTVTITAARGTIGYVAPELISRSIGAVSYKADVYSFGMLLMEMVGLKRDLMGNNDNSSQYFPYWIYNYFNQGKDIGVVKYDEINDNDSSRKLVRKMTIVALWCIQMSPDNRPSMNKVLEMLEADVERLNIPDYPSQSTQTVDQIGITCSTDSVSSLHHNDASPSVEIIVQEIETLP